MGGSNVLRGDSIFFTLRQCPRSHIYTVVPLDTFDAPTLRDINSGKSVATVAYVGREIADVMGSFLTFNKHKPQQTSNLFFSLILDES